MSNKLTRLLLLALVGLLLATSCSSTKRREDQSMIAKAWHNTNAHFNGYFNANEILEQSLVTLNEQHVDNYNQRLELFPFLAIDNPGAVAGELDRAIEKVAIVVKKHPYSNWTDDSYLLVGKAQLVKQDYEGAERTLGFTVGEFRPRPKRKKLKKGEKAPEEEEFESRREIEVSKEQSRRDRIRARKQAQKERDRVNKQRNKERKQKQRERDRERKARIRARRKGIRLPKKDTSAVVKLENEPEREQPTELDEGPIGMISIFSNRNESEGPDGEYGKKPGSYLLKHRPAHQEARLWLAWALIKRDNFDRAQLILDDLRNDRGTFADVRRLAMPVQAYLFLEQEKLEEAIPYLEAAGEVAKERNERARYYYIAGQLYQELNNPGPALNAFEQVVASKPAYELELGARINMAQNAYLSGTGSPEDALKQLERMTREEKNLPYESQILFSMAGIALRSGNDAAGAEYLRRALDSPYGGGATRIEAYQLLGDLAYAEEDYLAAKLYYDSTLQVMTQTDTRYPETSSRRDRLTGIATNLQTITTKDSLLRIGLLPERDRQNWAEEVFELRRATNSAANFSTPATRGSLPVANAAAGVGNSDFWAYDNQALKRGRRDFNRRWGDRSLEDNWRRSNKTDISLFEDRDDVAAADPSLAETRLVTEEEIAKILADVPIDEAAQQATRIQLSEAWFNLGRDFRDRLGNNPKAIVALETMNERYPGSNSEAESWYYLYLLHREEGNPARAEEYAKKLNGKYRGSKFAKLANDPNYASEVADREGQRTAAYDRAYAAFAEHDYNRAFQLAESGRREITGQHPLKARYALLQAMATGKIQGREAYIAALRQVISQYNDTPEQTRAKEILRLLGQTGARLPGRASTASTGFKPSLDEVHYMIIVFNDPEIDATELKNKISDYNTEFSKLARLRITPIYIGEEQETPMLVMRRFKKGSEAMSYYLNARKNEKEFLDPDEYDYELYPVSQSNYRQMLKARSVEGYGEWFSENY